MLFFYYLSNRHPGFRITYRIPMKSITHEQVWNEFVIVVFENYVNTSLEKLCKYTPF